jgi:hypothetical protein
MDRSEFAVEPLSTLGVYNVRLERWPEMTAGGETSSMHAETYPSVGWITAPSKTVYVAEVSRAMPDGTGRRFERLGNYSSLDAAVEAIREAYDENRDCPVAVRRPA